MEQLRNLPDISKVVGTTFRPLPEGEFLKTLDVYDQDGIPTALFRVILMPEPTNEFDPNAVAVVAELVTGSPYVIGYIGKDDPLQLKIKQPTMATMRVVDYSQAGNYNPAYRLIKIEME